MKKALSIFALTVLFSVSANAQSEKKATKTKAVAKTEKAACSTEEKKACGTEAKASCCSSKKAEAKKEE